MVQFIETESRMVVARSWGGEMRSCLRANSFSFARWIESWRCKCNFTEVIVTVQSLSCVQLWPHGLQHARLPCSSLSPRICSDSCPLSQWCYLTVSCSASPFFFCLQSFLASGSFPMSQLLASGGQSSGASASTSVLELHHQNCGAREDSWESLRLQGDQTSQKINYEYYWDRIYTK